MRLSAFDVAAKWRRWWDDDNRHQASWWCIFWMTLAFLAGYFVGSLTK